MTISARLVFAPLIAMVLLAAAAFGIPLVHYPDQAGPDVSDEALRRLRTQLSVPYDIDPGFLQIVKARMTGPTPDHVAGRGVWRTLFGIPISESQLRANQYEFYDPIHEGWLLGTWAALLLVEAGLGAAFLWLLWNAP